MTAFIPPPAPVSELMRRRLLAIEKFPADAVAFFRVGSCYEAYDMHATRIHNLFKELNRVAFGFLTKRDGITMTCTSLYSIHTLIAILQTEGITDIHVAEDGENLRTVRAWLAL